MIKDLFCLWLFLFSSLVLDSQETVTDDLLIWINQVRLENYLLPLERELVLEKSARNYGIELMNRGILTHRDLNNRGPLERYSLLGGTALSVGEILGTKKKSQNLTVLKDMWWESGTHREQLLNPRWSAVGLYFIETYGVEIYVIQFSSSLLSDWKINGTDDHYELDFTPLGFCETLIFHDVFAKRFYSWKKGEKPILIIKRERPSLLLEIFHNDQSSPSNRVLLY